ncbi:MAG: hypothetical protein BGO69_09795 [Bacteroidetes bacterium 46-16]|nr:MAG: hypothetical protein BGO69_09795 [Bacteroidetes bacterium 46-16]
MEITKKILNLAIAFCLVTISVATLIYSAKDNKASAQRIVNSDGFTPAGVVLVRGNIYVIGYNPKSNSSHILCSSPFEKTAMDK